MSMEVADVGYSRIQAKCLSRLSRVRNPQAERMTAWIEILHRTRADVIQQSAHPWAQRLERLRGAVGADGVERISTQAVFDFLEVPQRGRTAAACSSLARLMRGNGWTPIRTRCLSGSGYRDQVRGYAREPAT
jgi:hypothetical protein